MIMRIGWVTGSAYEWTQHWRVATTAGIPPEDILVAPIDRLAPLHRGQGVCREETLTEPDRTRNNILCVLA